MDIKPPISRTIITTAQIDEVVDEDVYQFLTHFANRSYQVQIAVELEETPRVPATYDEPASGGWEPIGMQLIVNPGSAQEERIALADTTFGAIYPTVVDKVLFHLESGV